MDKAPLSLLKSSEGFGRAGLLLGCCRGWRRGAASGGGVGAAGLFPSLMRHLRLAGVGDFVFMRFQTGMNRFVVLRIHAAAELLNIIFTGIGMFSREDRQGHHRQSKCRDHERR